MQYLLGLICGVIIGIITYIIWRRLFKKYLPYEDSLLLRIVAALVLNVISLISGLCISSQNKYFTITGIILYFMTLLIFFCIGIYYKTISKKSW